jgi:hypothetical protein
VAGGGFEGLEEVLERGTAARGNERRVASRRWETSRVRSICDSKPGGRHNHGDYFALVAVLEGSTLVLFCLFYYKHMVSVKIGRVNTYSLWPEIEGILRFLGQIKEVGKCHIYS